MTRETPVIGKTVALTKTVAALAIVGAVAASCSSTGGADSSTAAATSAGPSGSAATSPSAASPEDQAEITAITKTYITGVNNGDAKMLEHAMCRGMLDMYGDLSVGARPSPTPQQIDSITDIAVTGDSAIATVTYTLVSDPAAPAKTASLAYKNEGGWKICTVA